MILRFRGQENFLVGVGVLGEAGISWTARGGNELVVDGLDGLDAEQLDELAHLVRDPIETDAATSPGAAPGAAAAVAVVGDAPPRSGAGSSRTAWAEYAAALTGAGIPVTVNDDDTRDDIVAAVDEALEAHQP